MSDWDGYTNCSTRFPKSISDEVRALQIAGLVYQPDSVALTIFKDNLLDEFREIRASERARCAKITQVEGCEHVTLMPTERGCFIKSVACKCEVTPKFTSGLPPDWIKD
jgi:hypothetical protein